MTRQIELSASDCDSESEDASRKILQQPNANAFLIRQDCYTSEYSLTAHGYLDIYLRCARMPCGCGSLLQDNNQYILLVRLVCAS